MEENALFIMKRIRFIDIEIEALKEHIQPTDTGHIHTTIATLKWHRDELAASVPKESREGL